MSEKGMIQFLTDARVRMPNGTEHDVKAGDIMTVPLAPQPEPEQQLTGAGDVKGMITGGHLTYETVGDTVKTMWWFYDQQGNELTRVPYEDLPKYWRDGVFMVREINGVPVYPPFVKKVEHVVLKGDKGFIRALGSDGKDE